MTMIWRSLATAILLLAIGSARADPAFESLACALPGLDEALAPRLRCGSVGVPRDRSDSAAGTFRLAVVVVKSQSAPVQPDPVVFIADLPLTMGAPALATHAAAVLAPGRDLILVDARGIGRSEPSLCPALAEEQVTLFAAGEAQPALVKAWRQTYATCRLTMADDGIRPEWFGSQVSAEDLDDVRRALGIGRWNAYALSGGTPVATTLAALHPDSLRAVVLDGVLPPDPPPLTPAQAMSRAFDGLAAECGRDVSCSRAHADVAAAYGEAQRVLEADPLRVPSPAPGLPPFVLQAQVFRLAIGRLLLSRPGQAVLPSFIDAVRSRDAARVQPVLSEVMRRYGALPLGAMAAVGCRERPSWRSAGLAETPIGPFVPGECVDWSPPGPPPLVPQNTPVPTLLLAGAIDPVSTPAFAAQAAGLMGKAARVVTFPGVGQGAALSTPCGEGLVMAFVRDPQHLIDAACVDAIAPVPFR